MTTRVLRLVALMAVLALTSACAGRGLRRGGEPTAPLTPVGVEESCPSQPDQGVSADVVKLGGIYPLSGTASAYKVINQGAQAYFAYINTEKGGAPGPFEGRKIEFRVEDDAYLAFKAVDAVRELIDREEVFALFNTLGTSSNSAIWDFVNNRKVPQLFVASGASRWGVDVSQHPFTIGWQPPYPAEAHMYAEYLKQNKPDATVAVLFQDDDYGTEYLDGFRNAIEGSRIRVVAESNYEVNDPTVTQQMINLAASGADVFLNITTPKFADQALTFDAASSWNPIHILNSVSASAALMEEVGFDKVQGVISATFLKDPADPSWADDAAMREFKQKLLLYAPRADGNDAFTAYGWAAAQALVKVMEHTGCATRQSIMRAVRNLHEVEVPMLLPGITMTTKATEDAFPLEALQLTRFEGESWKRFGEVIDTREEFGPLEPQP